MEEIVKLMIELVSDDLLIRKIGMCHRPEELARCTDERGDTLLMHALFQIEHPRRVCTPVLIEHLLQLGSDPNLSNRYHGNTVQRACWAIENGASPKVLDLMLSYGMNPNIEGSFVLGGQRLHTSILNEQHSTMSLLLLYGAKLNDGEYEILSRHGKLGILTDFYDRVKLSHISLAHIKRIKHTFQKC